MAFINSTWGKFASFRQLHSAKTRTIILIKRKEKKEKYFESKKGGKKHLRQPAKSSDAGRRSMAEPSMTEELS